MSGRWAGCSLRGAQGCVSLVPVAAPRPVGSRRSRDGPQETSGIGGLPTCTGGSTESLIRPLLNLWDLREGSTNERSRSANQNPRTQPVHRSKLGRRSSVGQGSNPSPRLPRPAALDYEADVAEVGPHLRSSWRLRNPRTSSSPAVPLPCHSQRSWPVPSGQSGTTPQRPRPVPSSTGGGDDPSRSGFASRGSE